MFGQITFYDYTRRYGFIEQRTPHIPNEGMITASFFFHRRHLLNQSDVPVVDRWVYFRRAPGLPGKGPQAVHVRFATDEEIRAIESNTVSAGISAGVAALGARKC